jgi:hypothetical protein
MAFTKKFYLNDAASTYSPAVAKGAWDDVTGQPNIGDAGELPTGAYTTIGIAETSVTNNWDVLIATFVTATLANNVSFKTSDVVTGVLSVLESNAAANDFTHIHIWVTTGNTDTVRGTLLNDSISATEWPTTTAGQNIGTLSLTNNVNALAGDHIVIEIGYRAVNTSSTSFTGTLGFGTNDTAGIDLTDGDATVTTHPSWVEFSTDFGPEVVLLGSLFDTNSGTHTVTATPQPNDLIVIVTGSTGNTADTTPTDNNTHGGVYTQIVNPLKNSSADKMAAYVRTEFIQYKVSTVFTHAPGASTGGGLSVYAVRGMAKVGSGAIKQSASQAAQASGTPAPTFGASVLTGNPVISAIFNGTNPGGITAKSGYTRDVNTGYATPTTGFDSMHQNSGETGTAITWGSSSASAFCSLAIELDMSITTLQNQTDTFPGSSLDATKWYDNTQAGGTQTVAANTVVLTAPLLTAGALAEIESQKRYDLTGSYALAQAVVTQVANINAEAGLTAYHDEYGNQLQLIVDNGNLVGGYQIAGATTNVATIAYNSSTMAWWRIRESAGTIFFDYSSDGITWTNLGSFSASLIPWGITLVRTSVLAYDGVSSATAEVGTFSNFNNAPASTTVSPRKALLGVGL